MISDLFYTHGIHCSHHPVEVLLLCITSTVCLLTLNIFDATHPWSENFEYEGAGRKVSLPAGLHVGYTSYFLALLCIYLQCKNLIHQRSPYLLGFVSVFSTFSCIVFSSIVANLYGRDFWVVREALPYFFLLSDFSAACSLVKLALQSPTHEAVHIRIAEGIGSLGPTMTLNTLVGALVILTGTLSGIEELETICQFGCLSLLTHYMIFMTFFPAALSLFLQLSDRGHNNPSWQLTSSRDEQVEENEPNPVVQRIKLVMSAGLMFVHVHRWFMLNSGSLENRRITASTAAEENWFTRFLAANTEQTVALALAVILAVRYWKLDKENGLFENGGRKLPGQSTELLNRKAHFTVGSSLDAEGTQPLAATSNLGKISPLKLECSVGKEIITQTVVGTQTVDGENIVSKSPAHQSNRMNLSEQFAKSEDSVVKKPSLQSRRRTVSEGHSSCSFELGGHNPTVAHSELQAKVQRIDSSPSRVDYKERSLDECKSVLKQPDGVFSLSDKEIQMLVEVKAIPGHQLENVLKDPERAVQIRRQVVAKKLPTSTDINDLPCENYDFSKVVGACCENVIGYMPLPVGVVGPLLLDGKTFHVPMATTEGCLVASTNRGCRALQMSGGARSSVTSDGMTRGPVIRFPSAVLASEVKLWLAEEQNFMELKKVFDSTSRFARLKSIQSVIAGRLLFVRFVALTGDAMGMNMVSKGTEKALVHLHEHFPTMEILSLSGNYCTDKKATALNWIEGRGKSVVCEAIIPRHVVMKVLKTTVSALSELNTSKNLVGSAMAGAIGGFNAHAANIVTAVFIATGQDPAQCVSSSNCMTLLEPCGPSKEDLYISCTMPSLEVGTVGGGTFLGPQSACLKMLGVFGPNVSEPGQNATKLAQIICGTVLAGELSLLSALAAGHLVKSHLTHNRSSANLVVDGSKNCAVL